jgi:exodeoxyribonuclease VII large subunit
MVAVEGSQRLLALNAVEQALSNSLTTRLDKMNQRLDWVATRLGRPSGRIADQKSKVNQLGQSLQFALKAQVQKKKQSHQTMASSLPRLLQTNVQAQKQSWVNLQTRLGLLDPHLVLERGYAWITDESGQALTHVEDFTSSQDVTATLANGQVRLKVN